MMERAAPPAVEWPNFHEKGVCRVMRTKVETIPIALVEKEGVQIAPFQQADVHRRGSALAAAVLGLFAVLLIGACSSKNPDALTGMNVDENLAMMDANASSDGNVTAGSLSDTSATSNRAATDRADQSGDAAARTDARATSGDQQRSAEINAGGTDADDQADDEESSANQAQDDEEAPNGV